VKKENRDTEREGASLPAARVQARKWDAERERERERLQAPSDERDEGGDLKGSESLLTIVGPTPFLIPAPQKKRSPRILRD